MGRFRKGKGHPVKAKSIFLSGALTLACLSLSLRAQGLPSVEGSPRERDEAKSERVPRLGELMRADQIIGREIKDDQGGKIGKVSDLAVDVENGRVTEVIVATDGRLGMDRKRVAVPPSCFEYDKTMKTWRLNADQNLLQSSPEFNVSEWKESTDYAPIRETYQRFGVEPYFTLVKLPLPENFSADPSKHAVENYYFFDTENALPCLGYLARATRLMGTTARNLADERLGRVDDLVLDLPAGRAVEVILACGGFLGMGADLRAVPPQAFQWNPDNTALTLAETREVFKATPHFKAGEWETAMEQARIVAAYDAYHIRPYFIAMEPDNGAQKVREPVANLPAANEPTPLEQSNQTDKEITDKIRDAILANHRITSVNARNVRILTVDGKVILLGPADSQEEKRLLGEAAARIVSADKVENLLEVHVAPIYASPPATNPADKSK